MSDNIRNDTSNQVAEPKSTIKFIVPKPNPKPRTRRKRVSNKPNPFKTEKIDNFVHYTPPPTSPQAQAQAQAPQGSRDMQELFWHTTINGELDEIHPSTCECRPDSYLSCLQQRFQLASKRNTGPSFKELPPDWKSYYILTALSEHEQDQGGGEDGGGLEASMVGDSYWTSYEKNRFFVALDRCGRHRVHDIAKRVGPTKTTQEVLVYLNMLDQLAKVNPKEKEASPCAREMSPMFIMQEERMAGRLVQHLETESYKKHRELMLSKQYESAEKLFDLWKLTSEASMNDVTILISSLVQCQQLVRDLVGDIITTLYTEMTNEKDKTVTKERMDRVIAKRRQTWRSLFTQRPDRRLKIMDEKDVVVRKRLFRETFSRRRYTNFFDMKKHGELDNWEVKRQKLDNDNARQEGDRDKGDNDADLSEKNDDADDDDEDDDEDDKPNLSFYYNEVHESEDELEERFGYYGLQLYSEELENSSGVDDDDEEVEEQNRTLDKEYEKKLSKQLGFSIPK